MNDASTIGHGTLVRGSVRGEGDLEVLGRVEGSVAVGGELSIGEGALVRSDVRGRSVVVRGAVLGDVSADESIVLEAGARVVGDLGAPRIGIRPGALVRGNVTTGSPRESVTVASRAVRPGASVTTGGAPVPPAVTTRLPTVQRPAPAARPAPARPAPAPPARPAPRPAPRPEATPAPVEAPPAAHAEDVEDAAPRAPVEDVEAPRVDEASAGGPPPPVVPAIRKGQKAQMRRKGAR
jgi:cytoskeletal protein CcmA (bactofilin family)